MSVNVIELHCAVVQRLPNGILRLDYRDGYEVELADVKQVEEAFIQLSQGEPIYSMMLTQGKYFKFSSEAQSFLADQASIVSRIKGSAVVIDGLPIRLITNFFIRVYKPKFPTKIFKTEADALKWLNLVKKNNQIDSLT